MTSYPQQTLELSALRTGVRLLPMATLSLVCPPLAGRMVGSLGPRVPLLLAGAAIAAGGLLAIPATRPVDRSDFLLYSAYALFGPGFWLRQRAHHRHSGLAPAPCPGGSGRRHCRDQPPGGGSAWRRVTGAGPRRPYAAALRRRQQHLRGGPDRLSVVPLVDRPVAGRLFDRDPRPTLLEGDVISECGGSADRRDRPPACADEFGRSIGQGRWAECWRCRGAGFGAAPVGSSQLHDAGR